MSQNFVGLFNQGATCYMNSLLQTLFMTPEFRRRLYQWRYDNSKHLSKTDSIPYQLQLLFAKLQMRESPYCDTSGLTKSFQWDIRDSFQQHDVQEFCRVLFDAIEESVKGTDQEKMITELYEGDYLDFVRCLECGCESSRQDKFMDLALTVKSDFDFVYNDSVEKALVNFLKPDVLSGDNKYFCDNCGFKTDAEKGLKFKKLPYILVLQLKRFDLDYETMQRKKLNDKVSFPEILNMNPILSGDLGTEEEDPWLSETESYYSDSLMQTVSFTPRDIDSRELKISASSSFEHIKDDRDKFPQKPDLLIKLKEKKLEAELNNKRKVQKILRYLEQGEHVYELFSIMIHSGSALGGHYYAYIKDFQTRIWYNFNDTLVKEISEKDIEKVYGGISSSSWGGYGANAYLLMYRKVTQENNNSLSQIQVPEYLLKDIQIEQEKLMKEFREREEKLKQTHFKVYYGGNSKVITVRKDQTLEDLKLLAISSFQLGFSEKNSRLRRYYPQQDLYLDTFTLEENKQIQHLTIEKRGNLVLETKEEWEEFEEYDSSCIDVKVLNWSETILGEEVMLVDRIKLAKRVQIPSEVDLKVLMEKLQHVFRIPVRKQVILKKSQILNSLKFDYYNVSYANTPLSELKIFENSVLFLESSENNCIKWQQEIQRDLQRVSVKFNEPLQEFLDYNHKLTVQKWLSVGELKQTISQILKRNPETFLLRRGSKYGVELKNSLQSLEQCEIKKNQVLHVELGEPSNPQETRCTVFLASSVLPSDPDTMNFRFFDLFDLNVPVEWCVSELKTHILKRINLCYPTMLLKYFRVRRKNYDKLGKILKDEDNVRSVCCYEKTELAIQEIDYPENIVLDSHVILVRKWSPKTWELQTPVEVVLPKHTKLKELAVALEKTLDIPAVFMEACIIPFTSSFSRKNLLKEKWVCLHNNSSLLESCPFYLRQEGSLMIVKSSQEEMREMTHTEKEKFGIARDRANSFTGRERPIKIIVKKGDNTFN